MHIWVHAKLIYNVVNVWKPRLRCAVQEHLTALSWSVSHTLSLNSVRLCRQTHSPNHLLCLLCHFLFKWNFQAREQSVSLRLLHCRKIELAGIKNKHSDESKFVSKCMHKEGTGDFCCVTLPGGVLPYLPRYSYGRWFPWQWCSFEG